MPAQSSHNLTFEGWIEDILSLPVNYPRRTWAIYWDGIEKKYTVLAAVSPDISKTLSQQDIANIKTYSEEEWSDLKGVNTFLSMKKFAQSPVDTLYDLVKNTTTDILDLSEISDDRRAAELRTLLQGKTKRTDRLTGAQEDITDVKTREFGLRSWNWAANKAGFNLFDMDGIKDGQGKTTIQLRGSPHVRARNEDEENLDRRIVEEGLNPDKVQYKSYQALATSLEGIANYSRTAAARIKFRDEAIKSYNRAILTEIGVDPDKVLTTTGKVYFDKKKKVTTRKIKHGTLYRELEKYQRDHIQELVDEHLRVNKKPTDIGVESDVLANNFFSNKDGQLRLRLENITGRPLDNWTDGEIETLAQSLRGEYFSQKYYKSLGINESILGNKLSKLIPANQRQQILDKLSGTTVMKTIKQMRENKREYEKDLDTTAEIIATQMRLKANLPSIKAKAYKETYEQTAQMLALQSLGLWDQAKTMQYGRISGLTQQTIHTGVSLTTLPSAPAGATTPLMDTSFKLKYIPGKDADYWLSYLPEDAREAIRNQARDRARRSVERITAATNAVDLANNLFFATTTRDFLYAVERGDSIKIALLTTHFLGTLPFMRIPLVPGKQYLGAYLDPIVDKTVEITKIDEVKKNFDKYFLGLSFASDTKALGFLGIENRVNIEWSHTNGYGEKAWHELWVKASESEGLFGHWGALDELNVGLYDDLSKLRAKLTSTTDPNEIKKLQNEIKDLEKLIAKGKKKKFIYFGKKLDKGQYHHDFSVFSVLSSAWGTADQGQLIKALPGFENITPEELITNFAKLDEFTSKLIRVSELKLSGQPIPDDLKPWLVLADSIGLLDKTSLSLFKKNVVLFNTKGKNLIIRLQSVMGGTNGSIWKTLRAMEAKGQIAQFGGKYIGYLNYYNRYANAIRNKFYKQFIFGGYSGNNPLIASLIESKPMLLVRTFLKKFGLSSEIGINEAVKRWYLIRKFELYGKALNKIINPEKEATRKAGMAALRRLLQNGRFTKAIATKIGPLLAKLAAKQVFKQILQTVAYLLASVSGIVTGGISWILTSFSDVLISGLKRFIRLDIRGGLHEMKETLKGKVKTILKVVGYPLFSILACGCACISIPFLALSVVIGSMLAPLGLGGGTYDATQSKYIKVEKTVDQPTNPNDTATFTISITNTSDTSGEKKDITILSASDILTYSPKDNNNCSNPKIYKYGEPGFVGTLDKSTSEISGLLTGKTIAPGETISEQIILSNIPSHITRNADGTTTEVNADYFNVISIKIKEDPGKTASATATIRIGDGGCSTCPAGWPTSNFILTQGPDGSYSHRGVEAVDLATGSSTPPVIATFDGVAAIGNDPKGYGKHVVLTSRKGFKAVFAHMSVISVHNGETVRKGQQIGNVGSTGNSTGNHLHYEFRRPLIECIPGEPLRMEDIGIGNGTYIPASSGIRGCSSDTGCDPSLYTR